MQDMEVDAMDNETGKAVCECELDMEGVHQCQSCTDGLTNPLDFLRRHDMDVAAHYDCEDW